MPTELIMPMLGDTMDKGTIVEWLVREGQSVERGEPIYNVETDKAVLAVEAPTSGVLHKILVQAGAEVPILTVVGLIAAAGEKVTGYDAPIPASSAAAPPRAAEPGSGTPAARPPSKRAIASPRARKAAASRGVNLALVTGTGPGGRVTESDVLHFVPEQAAATPTARKVAAKAQIDLSTVSGTGPGGRITSADVEAVLREPESAGGVSSPSLVPLSAVRRRTAERMSDSAHTAAAVTLTTEADATALVELRATLNERYQDQLGHSISYNDILVAITAQALVDFPYMNARWTDEGVELRTDLNVGVAVDTDGGLLVPVVRNADQRGIRQVAQVLRDLIARARAGKSTLDDLTGGSFTITNLGMFGIDAFTPIINLPECAILGVGRIALRPALHEGQICARRFVHLSLTFDHRVVDGAPAARFLQAIMQRIERPYLLPA